MIMALESCVFVCICTGEFEWIFVSFFAVGSSCFHVSDINVNVLWWNVTEYYKKIWKKGTSKKIFFFHLCPKKLLCRSNV